MKNIIMSRLVSSETHSTVSMGSNNIVFVVSLTVVSLAWIYVFQLYVFKVVEQKTRNAINLYGPKPTTIEGTFV